MKGLVIDKNNEYHTFLKKVFDLIDNKQLDYNWLISDFECYPITQKNIELLSNEWCWITGEELTRMIEEEDFQWIWGCFSAFSKNLTLNEVLKYNIPIVNQNSSIWNEPILLQHPLAEMEIIAWDSTLTIINSHDDNVIDKAMEKLQWFTFTQIGSKHHYLGNVEDVVAAGQIKINGKGAIKRLDNLEQYYEQKIYPR